MPVTKPALPTKDSPAIRASRLLQCGLCEKADPGEAKALAAGSFIGLAPGTPHVASVDGEMVVQLNNLCRLSQEKQT